MVKTEPGSNKEDHDALAVEDIEPEQDYGEDSHQGGDDTFDDSYGAGGADDIGFEGDEGGAGPSEIGKGRHNHSVLLILSPSALNLDFCALCLSQFSPSVQSCKLPSFIFYPQLISHMAFLSFFFYSAL